MTQTAQTLLAMLRDDLARQDDQWRDEGFTQEMYRALTNRIWRKDGVAEAHVSVSWQLVDDMLKEIRAAAGEEPLDLDSSGGEGELSRRMEQLMGEMGWHSEPLNTSRRDPEHVAEPHAKPPPPDQGERFARSVPPDEFRRVHDDIDSGRVRKDSAGAEAAGGGEIRR
jgi:hypothetical protein